MLFLLTLKEPTTKLQKGPWAYEWPLGAKVTSG